MNYRIFATITAIHMLFSTADLAPAAQTERRVLDCAGVMKNIELALEQHVIHDGLTDDLAKQTAHRFLDGLLSYADLLSAKTVARLKSDRRKIDGAVLRKEMASASCAYFDERATLLKTAIEATKKQFKDSPKILAKQLIVRQSPEHALSAVNKQDSKAAVALRRLIKQYKKQADTNTIALFLARRYYNRLTRLERSLTSLGAEPMLRAFMGALDPYSSYSNAEETEIHQKILLGAAYSGIGVILDEPMPHGVRIAKLLDGGPAEKEGLLFVGSVITAIEGESVVGLDLEELHPRLTGIENSRIKLRIGKLKGRRLVEIKTVVVTRGPVKQSSTAISVSRRVIDGRNIVTLKLARFYGQCAEDVRAELMKVIDELKSVGGIHALVLDLRGNRGGRIDEAQRLVGLFIDQGPVYGVKLKSHEIRDDDKDSTKYEGALLVAIDSDTASAAEIVVGTLKDYHRALVVGDPKSYGKGTMQAVLRESQGVVGGSLIVTSGQYYTASGRSVQLEGVDSDIVVPGPRASKTPREAALTNAIPHAVYSSLLDEKQILANSNVMLPVAIPMLTLQSGLRLLGLRPGSMAIVSDAQLSEIEQVAADYAAFHGTL